MARHIRLHSPFDPVALATRLMAELGDRKAVPRAGVCGYGTDRELRMFVFRPNLLNRLATGLTATIDRDGSGTLIAGTIGTPVGGVVSIWLWSAIFGLSSLLALYWVFTSQDGGELWPMFAFLALMTSFGWGIWLLGTWNAAHDEQAILAFLVDKVQATEA